MSDIRTTADLTMEQRIDLLERALHETRQRCDLLTAALAEAATDNADLLNDPDVVTPVGTYPIAWDQVCAVQSEGSHLEPYHFQGDVPRWTWSVEAEDTVATRDQARLSGARETFLKVRPDGTAVTW